jgi:hypothetical protein
MTWGRSMSVGPWFGHAERVVFPGITVGGIRLLALRVFSLEGKRGHDGRANERGGAEESTQVDEGHEAHRIVDGSYWSLFSGCHNNSGSVALQPWRSIWPPHSSHEVHRTAQDACAYAGRPRLAVNSKSGPNRRHSTSRSLITSSSRFAPSPATAFRESRPPRIFGA